MEKSAEEKVKDAFLDGASESELLEIQQQKDMLEIAIQDTANELKQIGMVQESTRYLQLKGML
jgi:hypothetical protein